MKDSGLYSFCGVPGSGKTVSCVNIALKHYKKENSIIKRFVALFKYKISKNRVFLSFLGVFFKINIFNKFKFKYISWCKSHNQKVDKVLKLSIKFLLLILKLIFYLVLVVFLIFYNNWFVRFCIIVFIYRKRIIKWFNSLDYEYFCMFPNHRINNVYSNVPILLDKKLNIYSHKLSLWDLLNNYSFYPNSLLIIDEIQLFVDSDEYKEKLLVDYLNDLGNFNQAHRHFGIKNILVTSQGVTRIIKKIRDVCSGYTKLNRVFKLPFIPIGFISGVIYYDLDYFGKYIPRNREERKKLPFDYKRYFRICNMNKLFSSYDSRYLAQLNYSKPLLNRGLHTSLYLSENDIKNIFSKPDFLTKSKKEKLILEKKKNNSLFY